MPLLITGLEDELEEVSSTVWKLWEFAGQKWLEEEAKRDKRIKDMLDFPSEKEYNLPTGGSQGGKLTKTFVY